MRYTFTSCMVNLLPVVAIAGPPAAFAPLGFPAGGSPYSAAYDVSFDGSVVVGAGNQVGGHDIAWRWTEAGGFQDLGLLPNADGAAAQAVSADGSVVAGNSGDSMSNYIEAFRWTQATGMVGLGDLPGGDVSSSAADMSADGAIVAGISVPGDAFLKGMRWTSASGIVALPTLGGEFSVANGISADGTIIVGTSTDIDFYGYAVRWIGTTGPQLLPQPPGATSTDPRAVSADGTAVAGRAIFVIDGNVVPQGYHSSPARGVTVIENDPNAQGNEAHDISDDGNTIVGQSLDAFGNQYAFVWDAIHGKRDLREILINLGLIGDLFEFQLIDAWAISGDNRHIIGTAINPLGYFEAYRATVPYPLNCPGDLNGDLEVSLEDLAVLLAHFGLESGAAAADGDIDGDGDVDLADLAALLAAFGRVCP